jgi:type VI secretion system secreted protein Hcp
MSRSSKTHFDGRSRSVAVDIFMVIPSGSVNPPLTITADPVPDQYFKATFANAAIVQIRQFSLDVEHPTSIGSASAGAGTGKAMLNPAVIEKSVDTMSRSLFTLSATGSPLTKMQLYIRKAGAAGGKPYLLYVFNMVFVSKIDWSASSDDEQPLERVTFAYGALALAYYPQKPDGTLGTALKTSWSQVTNTEAPPDLLAGV